MTLQVLIKSPSQHVEDFKVDCDVTWTVGQVKDQISILYPSNPKKELQKLIYGGKLLSDHLLLQEVLNKNQEAHTMHLVCPLPPVPDNFKMFDAQSELRQRSGFAQEPFSTPPLVNPMYSGINQQLLNAQGLASVSGTSNYGSGVPVNMTYPPVDVAYQYMAVQQMYSQFMTQYLSQANGGVTPVNPYGYGPMQAPSAYQTQATPAPLPNERRVPNVPEQRQPIREEADRDYIDWLYLMSRALMLFAILYYYSSLTRILTVLFLGFFISLYVRVTRQYQRHVDEFHEQRPRPNEAPVENASRDAADIGTAGNEQVPEDTTPEAVANPSEDSAIQQEAQPYVSMLSVVLTFFSTLLTSLIPSEPAPVNIN